MKNLQEIATLDSNAQDLLEASGYLTIASLKEHSLSRITAEIVKANRVLEIIDEEPSVDQVREWLLPLKDELGELAETCADDSDDSDVVTERELLAASFAIPLSANFIKKNDIDVESLPSGRVRLLAEEDTFTQKLETEGENGNELQQETAKEEVIQSSEKEAPPEKIAEPVAKSTDDSIEIEETKVPSELAKPADEQELNTESEGSNFVEELVRDSLANNQVVGIDKKRIRTMDAYRAEGSRVAPLTSAAAGDLTRSARKETNAGKDPSSRRFVRGVLHKGAGSFMGSLFAYLVFLLCMIGGVVLPLLAVIDREKYFWAIFALALFVIGPVIFFMFTGRASCPICNQKQFRPRRCLKHRNAHRLPLLGYMLPTALHALFFRWFRCIFCGTSVRLKE